MKRDLANNNLEEVFIFLAELPDNLIKQTNDEICQQGTAKEIPHREHLTKGLTIRCDDRNLSTVYYETENEAVVVSNDLADQVKEWFRGSQYIKDINEDLI